MGLSLKRSKQVKPDLLTLPHYSRTDAVRAAYGAAIATNLAPFSTTTSWPTAHASDPGRCPLDTPSFSVEGLAATSNAAVKKSTLVLFINGRPADCAPLKSAIEAAYAALHSKAATFWAFVDVRVPAGHVDVNIHPTKSEVALLFQPELIEAVQAEVESVLASSHSVRTFARAGGGAAQVSGASHTRRPRRTA